MAPLFGLIEEERNIHSDSDQTEENQSNYFSTINTRNSNTEIHNNKMDAFKIRVPQIKGYNGERSYDLVESFINGLELRFNLAGVTDDMEKIGYLAVSLTGDALNWFTGLNIDGIAYEKIK